MTDKPVQWAGKNIREKAVLEVCKHCGWFGPTLKAYRTEGGRPVGAFEEGAHFCPECNEITTESDSWPPKQSFWKRIIASHAPSVDVDALVDAVCSCDYILRRMLHCTIHADVKQLREAVYTTVTAALEAKRE